MGTIISRQKSHIFKNDASYLKNQINKRFFEELSTRIIWFRLFQTNLKETNDLQRFGYKRIIVWTFILYERELEVN